MSIFEWRRGTGVPIIGGLSAALIAIVLVLTTGIGTPGAASGDDDADPEAAHRLAARFVPVIMIKEQREPCDPEGEPFWPMPVDVLFDNPEIALRQVSRNDPVVMRGPTAADLAGLGEGFYLDFPGDSLRPGCVYERDFEKYTKAAEPTVYAHVVLQADEPDAVYLQYWFYWYFNDWNNTHESDWEGIVLRFDASSIPEALRSEPVEVGYAQHEGGEHAFWDDDKLSRDGDRPVVYSSARSHASYLDSAFYLGRSADEGFGCDDTTGPSVRLDPEVVVLPDRVDDPKDRFAWLAYEGRWGERQTGAFNGPTGPASKDRWLEPGPWFEQLRTSSVVIPAGNTAAGSVIGSFCGVVEAGSGALIGFTTSPELVLIALLLLVLLVRLLVGLTDWRIVPIEPIVRRRRAGQLVRAAANEYRRTPRTFLLIGTIYLPALLITGVLSALMELVPFVAAIVALAGRVSGTSAILAVFVGSFSNIAAFVLINGIVSDYLRRFDRGQAVAIDAIRLAWGRRRQLLEAFARSFGIVFVLLVSVVGAPWGIRQLVRYQFVAQTVMYEGRSGRDALARSSELVAGRWFHTAIVAGAINIAVAGSALVLSLILLVIASGLPLWLFSILVSVLHIGIVPLAALAMTLLYGDAVADHDDRATEVPDREEQRSHQ